MRVAKQGKLDYSKKNNQNSVQAEFIAIVRNLQKCAKKKKRA